VPSAVGRGHVSRCRPLILRLQARGHECTVAALNVRTAHLMDDVCPAIAPESLPWPKGARNTSPAFVAVRDFAMSLAMYTPDVHSSTAIVSFLAKAMRDVGPDVVVVDQVVFAGMVARSMGLPVVQLTSGPYYPGRGTWSQDYGGIAELPSPFPSVRLAFESAGLSPPHHLDELLVGDLYISPTVPGLGTTPGTLHYSLRADLAQQRQTMPSRTSPQRRVAIGLGSTPDLLDAVVRGVLATDATAVIVDDRSERGARLTVGLPGVSLEGLVNLDELLPTVDAFVHHGGAGSSMDAFRAGVPAVVIPGQLEQFLNGSFAAANGSAELVPVAPGPLEQIELREGIKVMGHLKPHTLSERVSQSVGRLLDGSHSREVDGALGLQDLLEPHVVIDAIESLAG
jgi:UDP:flavonoid glycosyltransferase YjiC (YdhE family)